jgi:acyl carrier protein
MANESVTPEEIRNSVRWFVAKITERKPEEISDTAHFVYDLEIDSLMALEMMVDVNKRYKIEIMDEEFGAIKNVGDAVAVVQRHLAADHGKTK